jgi:hypothetical protein
MSIRLNKFHTASLALAMAINPVAVAKPPDLPAVSREAVAPQVEQIPVMPAETTTAEASAKEVDARVCGARRLYLIGERCRHEGDLEMAVNCYHEVELLSPHSPYGRKARRHLREIEAQRKAPPTDAGVEEQEIPLPMPPRFEIHVIESGKTLQPGTKKLGQKIPVLAVPLPPRNLTIYVEEPDSY